MSSQKLAEAIGNLSQSSQIFNIIAGKDQNYSYEAIQQQFKIIASEFQELSNGVCYNHTQEVLDGCIDVIVTIVGLMQQIQSSGIDVVTACERIADNNMSKYVKLQHEAESSVQFYKEKGIDVRVEYNPRYEVFLLKDTNNKIRKPSTFKDVQLTDLIPKELQTSGFPKVQ